MCLSPDGGCETYKKKLHVEAVLLACFFFVVVFFFIILWKDCWDEVVLLGETVRQ